MWAPRLKVARPKRGPVLGTLHTPISIAQSRHPAIGLVGSFVINICMKKLFEFSDLDNPIRMALITIADISFWVWDMHNY